MNSRSSLSNGGEAALRLCATLGVVGGWGWCENGSAQSSNDKSSSGDGDICSRDRSSRSSPSEASDESDGEMILAAMGPLSVSAGISWSGQVVKK